MKIKNLERLNKHNCFLSIDIVDKILEVNL
jgi:hypothetical protein